MICYALLAALALLGLGDARSATKLSPVYHVPLTTKLISYQRNHNEPVRESAVFLVGTISMGTPRQEIDVLFDLGSMEMIVPSTNSTTNHCDDYHCFNGNKSSTFKNTGKVSTQIYGAGNDSGIIAEETVQVGDLVVTKQAFVNCYTMDKNETNPNFGFHGIIGLNYRDPQDVIEQYSAPFLYNAVDQGVIDKKRFAISYPRGSKEGKLTIGGWDEGFVSEDKIVWLENAQLKDDSPPLNYWGITGVNDISAEAHGKREHTGPLKAEGLLVDTGNPCFLTANDEIFDALSEVFRNCGQDLRHPTPVKLSEVDEKLPTLTFDIQGHKFSFKPSQYIKTHDDCPDTVKEGYGLISFDSYSSPVVGGTFLRNFHTFYDIENLRMGLVPIAESADN